MDDFYRTYDMEDGEVLSVDLLTRHTWNLYASEIYDFIIQPLDPWISATESRYLEDVLRGKFTDESYDCFFIGKIRNSIIAAAGYQVSRRNPEVGVLGYVFTSPQQRGKGVCTKMLKAALEHFDDNGGRAMYLGTANPAAAKIYEKSGFKKYNGHVMRRLTNENLLIPFDQSFFSGRDINIRQAGWGDFAGATALFTLHHKWHTQDYTEGLFSYPSVEQTRCFSIFTSKMQTAEAPGNSLYIAETGPCHIVGIASLTGKENPFENHTAVFEFLIHFDYTGLFRQLYEAIVSAKDCCIEILRAYSAGSDLERMELLKSIGFSHDCTMKSQIKIDDKKYEDLEVFNCNLKNNY